MKNKTLSKIFFLICSLLLVSCISSYAAENTDCLKCHVTKPRMKGKVVHPAVNMGCTVCHSEAHEKNAKLPKGLSAEVPQLCFNCHDSKKFSDKVIHPPVSAGMCTNCHNPHTSDIEKLLTAEVPELCFGCHQKFSKKNIHPPAAAGLCLSCHAPHSGANSHLTLKPLNELCLDCHSEIDKSPHVIRGGKTGGHPLSGPKDPKRAGQPFRCISCHNPHESDSIKLLRYKVDIPFALCLYCHEK